MTMFKDVPAEQQWAQVKAAVQAVFFFWRKDVLLFGCEFFVLFGLVVSFLFCFVWVGCEFFVSFGLGWW